MENNKKQTAVQWLIEQIEEKGELRETSSIKNIQLNIDTSDYLDLKRQAKEMDKQQKIDAYDHHRCIGNFENGEQYYNETYKIDLE